MRTIRLTGRPTVREGPSHAVTTVAIHSRRRRQVVRIMNEADRLFGPLSSSDNK